MIFTATRKRKDIIVLILTNVIPHMKRAFSRCSSYTIISDKSSKKSYLIWLKDYSAHVKRALGANKYTAKLMSLKKSCYLRIKRLNSLKNENIVIGTLNKPISCSAPFGKIINGTMCLIFTIVKYLVDKLLKRRKINCVCTIVVDVLNPLCTRNLDKLIVIIIKIVNRYYIDSL